jgi:hypothetical protein
MAGSQTIWRVERWSNYNGKPSCYEVKYYQSLAQLNRNAGISNKMPVTGQPPQGGSNGKPYNYWVVVDEMQVTNSQMYV